MEPKEIVVISGKGGTGKTSITGGLAKLFQPIVLADCDVDAADLHLILEPRIIEKHDFFSGREPVWDKEKCSLCGICEKMCRFEAIEIGESDVMIDLSSCEGCGVCWNFCPEGAMSPKERLCGEWMVSSTKYGPMVHAKLGIAAENSGKLVTTVRQKAKDIAIENQIDKILIDGPPGLSCPVIASLTNAHFVVIVTEPTISGKHDLARVLQLTKHFNIPSGIIVNKWDVNEEIARDIIELAEKEKVSKLGLISYDENVTKAQVMGKTILDIECKAKEELKDIFGNLIKLI